MDEPENDVSTTAEPTLKFVRSEDLRGFLEKEDRLYTILHSLNNTFEEKLAALITAQIKRSID